MKILLAILTVILVSAFANAQIVPILDLKVGGLIGGVQNGKFVDAKTAFKNLTANQDYGLYSLEIGAEEGEMKITVSAPDTPCDDFYWISSGREEAKSGIAVGAGATWNLVPRLAKKMSLTDKTYLNVVSSILRAKGLPRAKARIEQAVRVDLDGDGVEEVLISASSYVENIQPSAKAGDYSFILLRKIFGGKAQNIMIAEEYIKKNIKFGAPNEFEFSAVLDLNGDGKMEIVTYGNYYEGSWAEAYEIKGNKPTKVLSAGCGV